MPFERSAEWIPAHKSNYRPGRPWRTKPVAVIIHIMEGTMHGSIAWFQNPVSRVSAHFLVAKNGRVVQMVRFGDTAYHARWNKGTSKLLATRLPGVDVNSLTVGIENEGKSGDALTASQVQANAWIAAVAARRFGFPLSNETVIGHSAIDTVDRLGCPGPGVPFTEMIQLAGETYKELPA